MRQYVLYDTLIAIETLRFFRLLNKTSFSFYYKGSFVRAMRPVFLGILLMTSHATKAWDDSMTVGVCAVAVSALALKGYHSYVLKDREIIKQMKDALKQKNAMKFDGKEPIIEIYNWNNAVYPAACAVKAAETACVDALVADAMSGKLVVIDRNLYEDAQGKLMMNGQLHWKVAYDIEKKLDDEIVFLNESLIRLHPYIYYEGYAIKQTLGLLGNSFVIDYRTELERACTFYNANVNDPSTWTHDQDREIERHMTEAAATTLWKCMRGYVHYGQASRLYWNIFKKRARLQAIRQALVKDIRFIKAKEQQVMNINLYNR